MEELATSAMQAYQDGDLDRVQAIVGNFNSPLAQYAIQRAKDLGNTAFSEKKYDVAVKHYQEALAATTDSKEQSKLYANCSAAYEMQKNYEKGLEYARLSIKANPQWSKGWFRAGKALFGKGEHENSLVAFEMANKKEFSCEGGKEDSVVLQWIQKCKQELALKKQRMKMNTDYKRFEAIDVSDDVDLVNGTSEDAAPSIEFSPDLSEEKRKQIEAMLLGNSAYSTEDSQNTMDSNLEFDFGKLNDDLPWEQHLSEEPVSTALLRYFRLSTQLRRKQQLYSMLDSHGLIQLTNQVVHRIETFSDRITEEPSSLKENWLFLGLGTCIPIIAAIQTAKRSTEALQQMPPIKGSSADISFTACAVESGKPLMASYAQMLHCNKVIKSVRVLPISPLKLTLEQIEPNMEGQCETNKSKDYVVLNNRFDHVCVDLSLFDTSLIGMGILPMMRHIRTLCTPSPKVIPSQAKFFIQGFNISLPQQMRNDDISDMTDEIDFADIENAIRWSPYIDQDYVSISNAPNASYGDKQVPVTEIYSTFEFKFDGDMNTLDSDISVYGKKDISLIPVVDDGTMNCLVFWYELYDDDTVIYSNSPNTQTEMQQHTAVKNENLSQCTLAHYGQRKRKQGIWWLPKSIELSKHQKIDITVMHNRNRIRIRQNSPAQGLNIIRRYALPSYHLNILRDPLLLKHIETSIKLECEPLVELLHKRLKRKQRLAQCIENQDKESSRGSTIESVTPLTVMCPGSAPFLPTMIIKSIVHSMYHSNAFKDILSREKNLKNTMALPVKLCAVDSLKSSLWVTKKVVFSNINVIMKDYDFYGRNSLKGNPVVNQSGWKSIKELSKPDQVEDTDSRDKVGLKCNSDLTILQKSQIKKLFSVLHADLRQVIPPKSHRDANCLLHLAQALKLPPGSNIDEQISQYENHPGVQKLDHNIQWLISMALDNGGIGEGLYFNSKYASHVLMDKSCGTFWPSAITLLGCVVELAPKAVYDIDITPWLSGCVNKMQYTEIDLENEDFKLLSNIHPLWNSEMSIKEIKENDQTHCKRSINIIPLSTGTANAVVFWFEIKLGDYAIVSTQPNCIRQMLNLEVQPDNARTVHYTQAWKQAVQYLKPQKVESTQSINLNVITSDGQINFGIQSNSATNETEESELLLSSLWNEMDEEHYRMSEAWMQLLSRQKTGDDISAPSYQKIWNAAIDLAISGGHEELCVDPSEIVTFIKTALC